MSKKDIEKIIYSGQIAEGLEAHDFQRIMACLEAKEVDLVPGWNGNPREITYHHARTTINTNYSSSKVCIKVIGESRDVLKVKEEFSSVYKELFERDLTTESHLP